MKESVGKRFSHASESRKVRGGLLSFFLSFFSFVKLDGWLD